ncbi:hypothetical protein D3C73_1558430 [compost metagenome]
MDSLGSGPFRPQDVFVMQLPKDAASFVSTDLQQRHDVACPEVFFLVQGMEDNLFLRGVQPCSGGAAALSHTSSHQLKQLLLT